MEESIKTLLLIDYQKGFHNDNSKKIIKPISKLVKHGQFDYIIQTMWFNSGVNNFTELLDYEECKVDGKDAGLIKLFPKAHVFPRVNMYSCFTDDLKAILKYNMNIYVAGWETDACVLGTVFQLFDYGFKFKILEDCVASKNTELEEATKLIMLRQFGDNIFTLSTELYDEPKKLFGIF